MNPDFLEDPWWKKRITDLESKLVQRIRQLDAAKAEGKGLRSANENLQEVVLKLSGTLGDRNDEIKTLQDLISERDSDGLEDAKTMDELRKSIKSKDEVLTVTLINLSNARAAQAELRGTDEYTARKMKQRIAELECLVLQAAVDKQVKRPDTKDECTRDIEISENASITRVSADRAIADTIQTGIRFVAPALTVAFITLLVMAAQVLTTYLAQ